MGVTATKFHDRTIIFHPHKGPWREHRKKMGISGSFCVLFPLCTTGFLFGCKYANIFCSQDLIPPHRIRACFLVCLIALQSHFFPLPSQVKLYFLKEHYKDLKLPDWSRATEPLAQDLATGQWSVPESEDLKSKMQELHSQLNYSLPLYHELLNVSIIVKQANNQRLGFYYFFKLF